MEKSSTVTIHLGKVTFLLREHHKFEWLQEYGEVFSVFDQQDSGNLCFGIEKDGQKKFVKFAGAKTLEYDGHPNDAIDRLQKSVELYEALSHPYLVKLEDHFQVEEGYVLVFEWFDGECLHSHWSFPPPAKYEHPDSPFFLFKQLPPELRLAALQKIYEFHVHVESKNFVAVDFYDGSIMYDFKTNETKICDIDLYNKKPFANTMGRLWGSSRFMSPEEFELGAVIDERTNVFNMGAVAFCLLGGELDRSFQNWDASKELYGIAFRAVERERSMRYSSVEEFYNAWNKVIRDKVSQ
ncbi:serine/threonine protein kinase [Lederbergia wuyishanensis]|uniref:Serine/threonine-protein kinase n=1 Tax=Lederbergia wuyishanensis TaxID=1347903 RepID=A0ABU0CYS7_9BACI|nr:serine/threonine protein kinase [Lederbergia wuyishanensis]MCJ8005944.1 serine/threonine protein kinase [Lederbergia wuyishanensis]MDQ0341309.1 serine/threonine-protein kinase [Lederbergia wuyishanensis]